jgi:hypothetical protein
MAEVSYLTPAHKIAAYPHSAKPKSINKITISKYKEISLGVIDIFDNAYYGQCFAHGNYGYMAAVNDRKIVRIDLEAFKPSYTILYVDTQDVAQFSFNSCLFKDSNYIYFGDYNGNLVRTDFEFKSLNVLNLRKFDNTIQLSSGLVVGSYAYLSNTNSMKIVKVNLDDFQTVTILNLGAGFVNNLLTDNTYLYTVGSYIISRITLSNFSTVTTLNLRNTDAEFDSFSSAFSDGTYAYYVPFQTTGSNSKVARILLSNFTSVSVLNLTTTDATLYSFSGGFTDGTYGYLCSVYDVDGLPNGKFVRFQLSTFSNVSVLDISSADSTVKGFGGCFSSGTNAYITPFNNIDGAYGKVARVNLSNFSTITIMNLRSFTDSITGYKNGCSDGKHCFLPPFDNGSKHGFAIKCNLENSGISCCNLANVDADLKGFYGAITDGKYVYFVPQQNTTGYSGKVARVSIDRFNEDNVSILNLTSTNAGLKGFWGGFSDGVYLYLAPWYDGTSYHGKVPKIQISNFTVVSYLDLTLTNAGLKGFKTGFTDGVYGYFVPSYDGTSNHGKIARVLLSDFSTVSYLDLTTKDSSLKGFISGFTDGRYGYFVPYHNGTSYFGKVAKVDLSDFNTTTIIQIEQIAYTGGFTAGKYAYFIAEDSTICIVDLETNESWTVNSIGWNFEGGCFSSNNNFFIISNSSLMKYTI